MHSKTWLSGNTSLTHGRLLIIFLYRTDSNNVGDDEYQTLKEGDLTTLGHFNGNDPTVVVVHGFGDHGDKGWPVTAKTGGWRLAGRTGLP